MKYRKPRKKDTNDLRLQPQLRVCPRFDPLSLADFSIAPPDEMGFRVEDNCAEEHIQ